MLKRGHFGEEISERVITTDPTAPRKRRGVGEEDDAKPKPDAATTDSDVAEGEDLAVAETLPMIAPQQTITFVGSGQVTCLLAGLIALQNRKLKAAGLPQIKISILGREGSESLEAIKTKGITLIMADGSVEKIEADEFFATDNADEIKNQDHIFVALKTTAYEDETSCDKAIDSINKMKKPEESLLPEKRTTITLAQNGIPCWLPGSIGIGEDKEKELSAIGFGRKLINGIGTDNIIGCILNLACKVDTTAEGKADYGTYHVSTPLDKIGTPLDRIDRQRRSNSTALKSIFTSSGISVAKTDMSLRLDVMKKLQINVVLNGLSAITGDDTETILAKDDYRSIISALAIETNNIAKLMGLTLRNKMELQERIETNAKHKTSMCTDFNLGKPLEIGSIYGALIQLSKALGAEDSDVAILQEMLVVLNDLVKLRAEGNSIEKSREEIKKTGLASLIELVKTELAPPSPKPKSRSPSTSPKPSPHRRGSISRTTGASSSDDGESLNITNYDSLVYKLNISETAAETTHATLTIKSKSGETSTVDDRKAMQLLCREFTRDETIIFDRNYINGNGKDRRVIKFSNSGNCIAISHEPVFKAFEKWCLTKKNLKFNSVHEKTGASERASMTP